MATTLPAPESYSFPRNRLRLTQNDPAKTPLVLVACGSFSPITYLHRGFSSCHVSREKGRVACPRF